MERATYLLYGLIATIHLVFDLSITFNFDTQLRMDR